MKTRFGLIFGAAAFALSMSFADAQVAGAPQAGGGAGRPAAGAGQGGAGGAGGAGRAAGGVTSRDPASVAAGVYELDGSHSQIWASVDHMGFSTTHVAFKKLSGTITYDPAKPEASTLSVSVDPASLDSGWPQRDEHLRGPTFFNAASFPAITFASSSLKKVDNANAVITGNLTLLGVTKPVTLNVKFNGSGTGMARDARIGFSARAEFKRSDFGMTGFLPAVGDNVVLQIDVEAAKK